MTGLDLVEWQLRVAAGEPLPLAQEDITQHGHAMEVRLYAEDPEQNFLPGSGRLDRLRAADARRPTCAWTAAWSRAMTVTIFYDPMIAKLIVWDDDRPRALARLRDALAATARSSSLEVERRVPGEADPPSGGGGRPRSTPATWTSTWTKCCRIRSRRERRHRRSRGRLPAARRGGYPRRRAAARADPYSPWAFADGWRLGHAGQRVLCFGWRERRIDIVGARLGRATTVIEQATNRVAVDATRAWPATC